MQPYKKGDYGTSIAQIQLALKKLGYNVDVDKQFGQQTFDAVLAFQCDNNLLSDGIVGEQTWNALIRGTFAELDFKTVQCVDIVKHVNDYYKSASTKTQICLHHTAGPSDPLSVVDWWNKDPQTVATAFVVGGGNDSKIVEAHPSEFWGWHLGVEPRASLGFSNRDAKGTILDSKCIGIELCNWGYLDKVGDAYFNYLNPPMKVKNNQVCDLGKTIRGKQYFQKYTDSQIEKTRILLLELAEKHSIDLHKTYDWNWFEISKEALSGKNGVWNHCNFRTDKIDIFPQQEMLDMLNSL